LDEVIHTGETVKTKHLLERIEASINVDDVVNIQFTSVRSLFANELPPQKVYMICYVTSKNLHYSAGNNWFS